MVFVRKESLVKDLQCFARRLVTPQLMGRAVRWRRGGMTIAWSTESREDK